jgi:hypothetical protein
MWEGGKWRGEIKCNKLRCGEEERERKRDR